MGYLLISSQIPVRVHQGVSAAYIDDAVYYANTLADLVHGLIEAWHCA